jgi:hypothetical protein
LLSSDVCWISNPSFFTYAASDRQHSDLDTTDVWKKKRKKKKKNQARQKTKQSENKCNDLPERENPTKKREKEALRFKDVDVATTGKNKDENSRRHSYSRGTVQRGRSREWRRNLFSSLLLEKDTLHTIS